MSIKIAIKGIQRFIINSVDPDELSLFYKNIFCFPLIFHDLNEKWYVFNAGNCEIAIHKGLNKPAKGQSKIVFMVDDIFSAHEYFKAKRIIVGEIGEYGNEYRFDISDIQGNDYQFYKYDNHGRF